MNISDLPNPIQFREIIWSEMVLEEIEDLGRLTSSCASTLEALTLGICDADQDPNAYHPLSLAENTKLKELTIDMCWICPTDSISHLISTITSPQLSKIWFKSSWINSFGRRERLSEENDWGAVDSALVRLREERAPDLMIVVEAESSHLLPKTMENGAMLVC